jgi:proteasome accessory factor B
MGVSDQKTERLLNLTMALLATRRFLSKDEIFNSVAGYSGNMETKERMFERDKDDLRALGITIHVGSHNPLFEDELGYRIFENEYELALGPLTPSELSYLSLAATIWRNQLFAESGAQALLKIDALAGTALREDFGGATLSLENETPLFPALWEAITTLRNITFTYRSRAISKRHLSPYGLTLWHGSWYLVGLDLDKNEIRVFRVSRITSEIAFEGKPQSFVIPEDFSIASHLVMLGTRETTDFTAKVRVGRCQSLRAKSKVTNIDGEWDRLEFSLGGNWLDQLLWFGADLRLESPTEHVDELVAVLRSKL